MAKTTTKYLCSLCGTEYDTESRADACEGLGLPSNTAYINEGDELVFTKEERGAVGGSVVTYLEVTGTVLYKIITLNTKTNQHQHIFICKVEGREDQEAYECGVLLTPLPEGEKFFAPSEYEWKVGFADSLRKTKV